MSSVETTDRAALTRRQIERTDAELTKEFPELPEQDVHREVAAVSARLLANAHFTDYIAVLTGRFAAEHLHAVATPDRRPLPKSARVR